MSLAYSNLKPVKIMDPRTNLRENKKYLFKVPGNTITYQAFNANSTSSTATTFKMTPPNPTTLVSRLMYHKEVFDVTIRSSAKTENGLADKPYPINDLLPGIKPVAEAGSSANIVYAPNVCNDAGGICLRQFPLSSVIQTNKLSVNGDIVTNEINRYIHALARFNLDDMARTKSISPAQCDEAQKYNDYTANAILVQTADGDDNDGVAVGGFSRNLGTIRSPFQQFGQNGAELPRSSYGITEFKQVFGAGLVGDTVNNTTFVTTTFKIEVVEPIFISPLSSGDSNLMALSQLSNLDYYVSWDTSKLERLFSVDLALVQRNTGVAAGNALAAIFPGAGNIANGIKQDSRFISSITLSLDKVNQSQMLMNFITPQLNIPIPQTLVYDYNEFDVHSQILEPIQFDPAAKPKEDVITSKAITLSSIPARIYIYIRRRTSDLTMYDSDAFFNLYDLSIQFNNVSGLLSSASESDLFKMSQDCGFQHSFPSWQYYGGSIICIPFDRAIGLPPNLAPGVLGQFSFQFKLRYKYLGTGGYVESRPYGNKWLNTIVPEMFTLVHSVGVYTITNGGQITKQAGVVAVSDTLDAETIEKEADFDVLEKLYGGSFMSGLKNIYSKLPSYARKGSKFAKAISEPLGVVAPRASSVLKSGADFVDALVGQGYSKPQANKMIREYSPRELDKMIRGSGIVAGGMVAGRMMSKSKLRSRIV